jgi:hypothetical protein
MADTDTKILCSSEKPTIVFEALKDGNITILSRSFAGVDGRYAIIKGKEMRVYWRDGQVICEIVDRQPEPKPIETVDDLWVPDDVPAYGEEGES